MATRSAWISTDIGRGSLMSWWELESWQRAGTTTNSSIPSFLSVSDVFNTEGLWHLWHVKSAISEGLKYLIPSVVTSWECKLWKRERRNCALLTVPDCGKWEPGRKPSPFAQRCGSTSHKTLPCIKLQHLQKIRTPIIARQSIHEFGSSPLLSIVWLIIAKLL